MNVLNNSNNCLLVNRPIDVTRLIPVLLVNNTEFNLAALRPYGVFLYGYWKVEIDFRILSKDFGSVGSVCGNGGSCTAESWLFSGLLTIAYAEGPII